jgi:signal transduction histidine kinase
MTDRHDRHFDAEDQRMLRLLADFAGACWVQWKNWEAASAENRRRDEIVTTLIHELRNPLAAITAAACVIERTAGLTADGG